jgi:hypothetical protein
MNFYSSSINTALTILQRKSEYPFFTPARVLGRHARRRGGTSGARAAALLVLVVPPNKPRYRRYRQINQAVPPVPPKTQSVPKKKPHPLGLGLVNGQIRYF